MRSALENGARFGAKLALVIGLGAMIAGCGNSRRPTSRQLQQIDRALERAPGKAQPSSIVKSEIAFARMAREDGQWTAFGKFAAFGAQIHGPNGPMDVASFIAGKRDPKEAVQWRVRSVWMSCDGSTAVSQGRFRNPAGLVGNYVTVWERQRNGQRAATGEEEYRFIYDLAAPDNPQPPPRPAQAEPQPGDIVVEAIDAVRAEIGQCRKRGETAPAAPVTLVDEGGVIGGKLSRDGTLKWAWAQDAAGGQTFTVHYLENGAWTEGYNQEFPRAVARENP